MSVQGQAPDLRQELKRLIRQVLKLFSNMITIFVCQVATLRNGHSARRFVPAFGLKRHSQQKHPTILLTRMKSVVDSTTPVDVPKLSEYFSPKIAAKTFYPFKTGRSYFGNCAAKHALPFDIVEDDVFTRNLMLKYSVESR